MDLAPTRTQGMAMSEAPLIRLDRVGKEFGRQVVALQDMSLTVRRGDFVSLLGPSGCGKSTVLRLIAGLMPATSGTISIVPGGGEGGRDLGFVFQEPTLMPWATVFENVRLPLRVAGLGRAASAERVRRALVDVGLSRFEDAYPRELSGGMKMRVSIARAMVTRPRILLMDEPFAALDEITRGKLNRDVIRLAHEHGLTVVLVTHSVFEAVWLSNRIVVMAARPGRVVADLTVEAPWPRAEDFRLSETFTRETRRVSETLKATLTDDAIDH